jgi:hypothetical protein
MDNFQEIVFQISNANGKPRTSKQKMSSEWTLHTQLAAAQSGNANVAVRIANDTAAVAVAVAVSLGRATHPAGIGGREAHLVRGSTFIIYHQSVRNFLLVVCCFGLQARATGSSS